MLFSPSTCHLLSPDVNPYMMGKIDVNHLTSFRFAFPCRLDCVPDMTSQPRTGALTPSLSP